MHMKKDIKLHNVDYLAKYNVVSMYVKHVLVDYSTNYGAGKSIKIYGGEFIAPIWNRKIHKNLCWWI